MEAQGVLRGGKRVHGVRYLGCCTVAVNRGRCVAVFGWCPLRGVMSPCQFPALLSRNPTMSAAQKTELVARMARLGLPTQQLISR